MSESIASQMLKMQGEGKRLKYREAFALLPSDHHRGVVHVQPSGYMKTEHTCGRLRNPPTAVLKPQHHKISNLHQPHLHKYHQHNQQPNLVRPSQNLLIQFILPKTSLTIQSSNVFINHPHLRPQRHGP
jgi:hypothetical protein